MAAAAKVGVSRSLLLDIATRSSLDDASLSTVCAMRPDTVSVISYQVLYVAAILSQILACHYAANRKMRVRDLLMTQASESKRPRGIIAATPSQLRVVIVGGGTVGRHIASAMMLSGMLHPSAMSIVTRQPGTLRGLSEKGVRCFAQHETDVLRTADLIVLAVQPSQLYAVGKRCVVNSESILRPSALVVSVLCGATVDKICGALQHSNCMTTYVEVGSIAAAVQQMSDAVSDQEQQDRQQQQRDQQRAPHAVGALVPGRTVPDTTEATRRRKLLELAFPRDGSWVTSLGQEVSDDILDENGGGDNDDVYEDNDERRPQHHTGDDEEGGASSRRDGDGDTTSSGAYYYSANHNDDDVDEGDDDDDAGTRPRGRNNEGQLQQLPSGGEAVHHRHVSPPSQQQSQQRVHHHNSNSHPHQQQRVEQQQQHHHEPLATFYFLDRFIWCLMQSQQQPQQQPSGGAAAAASSTERGDGGAAVTSPIASLEALITTCALLLPEGHLRKQMLEHCDASDIQRALVVAATTAASAQQQGGGGAAKKPVNNHVSSPTSSQHSDEQRHQQLVATMIALASAASASVAALPQTGSSLHHQQQHRPSPVVVEATPTLQWCAAVLLREHDPFVVVEALQTQFIRLLW